MNSRSFFLSALIAGAITGFLGNLPILNLINCFLCVFAWVGGALSVIFYRRFQRGGPELTNGQGAGLGAVSGFFGAVIGIFVFLITSFISTPIFNSLYQIFDPSGNSPFSSGVGPAFLSAGVFFCFNAVLYTAFSAISALITTSITNKKPAA
jgi:hypothetical protein